jgi:hypothetical protein
MMNVFCIMLLGEDFYFPEGDEKVEYGFYRNEYVLTSSRERAIAVAKARTLKKLAKHQSNPWAAVRLNWKWRALLGTCHCRDFSGTKDFFSSGWTPKKDKKIKRKTVPSAILRIHTDVVARASNIHC